MIDQFGVDKLERELKGEPGSEAVESDNNSDKDECVDKKWPQYNTNETAPLILFSIVRNYESFIFFIV